MLILVLSVCIRFVCDRMAARASYAASVDVKRILRKKIYEKLLRLGASYREQTATSEIVQMSSEGVEQLEIYSGKYLPQLFFRLLAPLTLFAVLSRVIVKASAMLLLGDGSFCPIFVSEKTDKQDFRLHCFPTFDTFILGIILSF